MSDKEYLRLKRLVITSFLCLFGVIILITMLGSYKLKDLHTQITSKAPQVIKETTIRQYIEIPAKLQVIQGEKGEVGSIGQSGSVGAQGIQGPQGIQGEKGDTGIKGSRGATGNNGKVVFVDITGTLCRYAGDLLWQPIEECGP